MPNADSGMAVGEFNNTVLIIGGHSHSKQHTEFNTNTETFTDAGQLSLSQTIYGFGQFYTLISQTQLAIANLPNSSWMMSVFKLDNRTFILNWVDFPTTSVENFCLTSTSEQIFVVGGTRYCITSLKAVHTLTLTTREWNTATNTKYMEVGRSSLSCATYGDSILYAIGGYNSNGGYLQFELQSCLLH